jgi:hypothetical protein
MSSLTTFNYTQTFSQNYKWTVYELNESSLNVENQLDLSGNPSRNSANLVFGSNTLTYGLYKFVLLVNMDMTSIFFQEELTTYIRIIPTGINVYGLENGLTDFSIGQSQGVKLKPDQYSADPDLVTNTSTLAYKFYCKLVAKSLGYVNYLLTEPTRLDLDSIQSQYLPQTDSCFSSLADFSFDSTKNKLNIDAGVLKSSSTKNNIFVIKTENLNRVYYQVLNIGVCGNVFNFTPTRKFIFYQRLIISKFSSAIIF